MKRFLKYGVLSVVFVFGVLVLVVLLWPAPKYRAGYAVPGTDVELVIELKPMHPFLAEYERTLIVLRSSEREERKMFPDTGGYLRTNVYSVEGGRLLVKGFFDEWLVQTDPLQIDKPSNRTRRGTFIGAFD